MENNEKRPGGFKYTYSAAEQAELRRIREKYTGKREEDKMARLRRLDAGVTQKAQAISLIFGIVGILIFGFGMSLVMSDLAAHLGMTRAPAIALAIVSALVGGTLAGFAYPMYNYVTKRERARVAPEILRLTDELIK